MNDLLVERFFSVAVELTDGRSTQLKVRGETPADAFKEVRSRADVRRVGKVSEIDESTFHTGKPVASVRPQQSQQSESGSSNHGRMDRHQGEAHQAASGPTAPREALIGFTISGPRVIRAAKPLGYEQPFKNFRARPGAVNTPPPPEPGKPKFSPFGPVQGPVANDPSRPPVFAKPTSAAEAEAKSADAQASKPASVEAKAPAADESTPATREYRIQKSRRQTGEPYLLQRGTWGMLKGKRTFSVEWEKGFPTREKAEKQQAWLEQMARESAELQAAEE